MSIEELISRLEKLTGPDRELDAAIAVVTFVSPKVEGDSIYARLRDPGNDATHAGHYFIKSRSGAEAKTSSLYTSSIDEALTLVEEGVEIELSTLYHTARAAVGVNFHDGPYYGEHKGCLLAIALCIAALRARSALTERGK